MFDYFKSIRSCLFIILCLLLFFLPSLRLFNRRLVMSISYFWTWYGILIANFNSYLAFVDQDSCQITPSPTWGALPSLDNNFMKICLKSASFWKNFAGYLGKVFPCLYITWKIWRKSVKKCASFYKIFACGGLVRKIIPCTPHSH